VKMFLDPAAQGDDSTQPKRQFAESLARVRKLRHQQPMHWLQVGVLELNTLECGCRCT
jgi:hypothetical protein